MTKTIYTRIINKKTTSVELKSVLGAENSTSVTMETGQMFSTNFLSATHQNSSASILPTMKHGRNSTMSM